jgi:hypothetical protein
MKVNSPSMTHVIKKDTDPKEARKLIAKLARRPKFDAHRFCGVITLKKSPVAIQKELRDEWK